MVMSNRVILMGTVVAAALLVGVTVPAVVPSFAATNSHSYNISPNDIPVLSLTRVNNTVALTVTALNGTILHCTIILSISSPTEVGYISLHAVNGSVVYYTVGAGNCTRTNG